VGALNQANGGVTIRYDATQTQNRGYDAEPLRAWNKNPPEMVDASAFFGSPAQFNAARTTPNLKTVTSWADEGITPDLNPGRWVQLGEATTPNFWKTGLPGPKLTLNPLKLEGSKVPFSNSVTGQVPASSLQWPSGWEKWKGILGQRQITGGGQ